MNFMVCELYLNKDALKINPVSKDNVYIDYTNKFIVCFAGYLFTLKYQYEEEKIKKTSIGKIQYPNKIKSIYSNSEACRNCFYKDQCLTEKMTNRQYTVYGSEDMIEMLLKMETPEAKEKYSLRPVVEYEKVPAAVSWFSVVPVTNSPVWISYNPEIV